MMNHKTRTRSPFPGYRDLGMLTLPAARFAARLASRRHAGPVYLIGNDSYRYDLSETSYFYLQGGPPSDYGRCVPAAVYIDGRERPAGTFPRYGLHVTNLITREEQARHAGPDAPDRL